MNLKDFKKENVFKIPEDYFQTFSDRLEKRILERSDQKTSVIPIERRAVRWAVAASLALLIGFGIFRIISQTRSTEEILSSIPSSDLIAYLKDTDLSTDEVLDMIDNSIIVGMDGDYLEQNNILPENMDDKTIDELINEFELEQPQL